LEKFELINRARKILGLGEEASWEEIVQRYRELTKKNHPDKGKNTTEKIKKINWAYEILKDYYLHYPLSFRKEDVEKLDLEERLKKQFWEGDWLSGKK